MHSRSTRLQQTHRYVTWFPILLICVVFLVVLPIFLPSILDPKTVVTGVVSVIHADNFEQQTSEEIVSITSADGSSYTVTGGDALSSINPGFYRIRGKVNNGRIEIDPRDAQAVIPVSSSGISAKDSASAANTPFRTLGEQRTAAILVEWPGYTNSKTPAIVDNWIADTDEYVRINSKNKASVSGKAFGPYSITGPTTCDTTKLIDEAVRVSDADIDFRNYDHIVVVGPLVHICSWGGLAVNNQARHTAEGELEIWGELVDMGAVTFGVYAHEVLHNLGLSHSKFLGCGNLSINPIMENGYPKDCSREEYGDLVDVMSSNSFNIGHLNAIHLDRLGWFDSGELVEVNESGTYTLAPMTSELESVKALKIKRGSVSFFRELYVEYRQPLGIDANITSCAVKSIFEGALFHVGYGDIDESWLIAADPPGSWCNSSLGVGKTFTDQATGTTVEVLSKTPQEITVSVQLGTLVTLPPTVTPSGSPNTSPQPCSESNAPYSIYTPPGYAFIPRCFSQGKTIYSDDLRFTFFNTRSLFEEMHYIQTGNVREKDDRDLSWSINLKSPATVFIFYRKIPGQVAPAWITQNYEKRSPNSFEDVSQFLLRKNDLGLIGVYDIYSRTQGANANVVFYPASDSTTSAYSMYLVGVKPL